MPLLRHSRKPLLARTVGAASCRDLLSIKNKKTPACQRHPGSDTQQVWGDRVASPLREVSRQVTNALMKLEQKTLQEFPAPRNPLFLEKISLQSVWRRDGQHSQWLQAIENGSHLNAARAHPITVISDFSRLAHALRIVLLHGIGTSCPAPRFSNDDAE